MFLKQSSEGKFYSPVCKQEQWDGSDDKLLLLCVILIKVNIRKKDHGLLTVLKQSTVLYLVTHYEQKPSGISSTHFIFFFLCVTKPDTFSKL